MMKRKFTKLMAAVALLTLLFPLTGWGQTTKTLNIANYASANNWENQTQYMTASIDDVTFTATGSSNTGKYYTADYTWRFYANESATLTISMPQGYGISSVTPTFTTKDNGTLVYGSSNCTSGAAVSVSGNSVVFTISQSSGNKGKVFFTEISVTYTSTSGPTLENLSYTGTPNTTTYEAGDVFDPTGLTVYANYSDETQVDVTANVVWTPSPLTQGTTSVTGTYNSQTVTVSGITVNAPAGPDIVLSKDNSPFTSTSSSNTDTETVTLDGIEYQNYAGYVFSSNYLSFNRAQEGGYLGNNTVLCGNIKRIVVSFTAAVSSNLTMYEGTEALAETTAINPVLSNSNKTATYTFSGNSGYFKYKLTTTGTYCNINSISIYLNDCDNPAITVSPNSLTGFTYVEGNGPSEAQTFTVSGAHLTTALNMSLDENSDFEISQSENDGYVNSIVLTPSDGTVANTTIYARLKAGKVIENYNGTITLTSTDATTKTVSLGGTVTAQLYTLSDESGVNGSITFSASPVAAGTPVTLTPTPVSDAYYFVPDSWSFFNEALEDVTSSIVFVEGETNVIEMPAFNLLVDASFLAKPSHTVAVASNIEHGTVVATPASTYEGQTVTLTITPAEGYYLESVAATYVDGDDETQNLTITNNTFAMPNYDVTVTATFASNTYEGVFGVYSGDLTEGDYLLVYKNKAINNVVSSKKLGYETVAPSQNNTITNPDRAIVWRIASSTTSGYWTIYNAQTNKYLYAANNSTDVNLVEGINAASKWGVVGTYDFQTLGNEGQSTTRYLRYFAASDVFGNYAASNGGALTLYKLVEPYAPEWSTLPTPSIFTGNEYELTLTDYVSGYPAPSITLATEVSSTLYEYEDGYFTFQSQTTGNYEFTFTAENSVGSADATLTITVAAPQQYTLTVAPFENLDLITFVNDEVALEADGTIQVNEGDQIMLSVVALDGYEMGTLVVNSVDHVNDIDASSTYTFVMPSENVTISATAVPHVAPAGGDYVRITNLAQLGDGSKVIIAARYNTNVTEYKAMPNTTSGKPEGVAFISTTYSGSEIIPSSIFDDEDDYYWTVNVTENGYTFTNASGDKIGYGTSGTDFVTNGTNSGWTIERSTAGNSAMVVGYSGFVIKNKTTNTRAFAYSNTEVFGAYATGNMNGSGYNFYLDIFAQLATYELTIYGYNDVEEGTNNQGYYLIASPVYADPADVTGMTAGYFDLYYFDEAQDHEEWRNYEATPFNLVPGKGYLYAKKATNENPTYNFKLTGAPYNGNGQVTLSKADGTQFSGWNLIGNPFGKTAEVDKDFYRLTPNGFSTLVSEDRTVDAMEGVFVVATEEGEYATFAIPEESGQEGFKSVALNVVRDRAGIIDRAIVRIGEGRMLPKFQLNANNTKIYITEGNQDYAIVYSNNDAEIPVSFKAAERGTYTINVDVKNVEMTYLHLIDNLTGDDVDLLQTPSYTFEANKGDNASRFRLVFNATGIEEDGAETSTFAYFNGSEWVVSGPSTGSGTAVLQVIDMMGRVISSEQINGNANLNLNQAAGVYMLRLVNGENVMVQKVVVR